MQAGDTRYIGLGLLAPEVQVRGREIRKLEWEWRKGMWIS